MGEDPEADEVEPPRRGRERTPYLLRLPPDLMQDLRAWAAQDLRSLNAQIEYLLREALKRRAKGSR